MAAAGGLPFYARAPSIYNPIFAVGKGEAKSPPPGPQMAGSAPERCKEDIALVDGARVASSSSTGRKDLQPEPGYIQYEDSPLHFSSFQVSKNLFKGVGRRS